MASRSRGPYSDKATHERTSADGPSSASSSRHVPSNEDTIDLPSSTNSVSSASFLDEELPDGSKPADLYGKFTWKIETFSEISKRELRSNIFEVGGFKWYILVYPQGCDVCNHLSLFLCVADYDKLLPGWNHFAQFTIAVVNKDPKKSKYSDTLHRFCKKEHDWGWKKFMELSKVLDGFTGDDTLVIKAQVQVIKEKPQRPFRCLDSQYRLELVRVYLTNVESICRRFIEEKRDKLAKLLADSARWSSLRAFWVAGQEAMRRQLSCEDKDVILRAVVKRFFNDKEVTSTLVMDALYSGCVEIARTAAAAAPAAPAPASYRQEVALAAQAGGNSGGGGAAPILRLDGDEFVLAGDALALLERAAAEPLPLYFSDKATLPLSRSKEGVVDDAGKEAIERDERRLTELGRRTIEIFVLTHLFSNRLEVAYREAVALRRQEELIREEEAAEQAELLLRSRREQADRERRVKKKQAKQRKKDKKEKEAEKKVQAELAEAAALRKPRKGAPLNAGAAGPPTPSPPTEAAGPADDANTEDGDEEEDPDLEEESGVDVDSEPEQRHLSGHVSEPETGAGGRLSTSSSPERGDAEGRLSASAGSGAASTCHVEPDLGEVDTDGDACSPSDGGLRGGHKGLQEDGESSCSSDSSLLAPPPGAANGLLNGGSSPAADKGALQWQSNGRKGSSPSRAAAEHEVRPRKGDGAEPSSWPPSAGPDSEAVISSLKERVRWLEHRLQQKEMEVLSLQRQLTVAHLLQENMPPGSGKPHPQRARESSAIKSDEGSHPSDVAQSGRQRDTPPSGDGGKGAASHAAPPLTARVPSPSTASATHSSHPTAASLMGSRSLDLNARPPRGVPLAAPAASASPGPGAAPELAAAPSTTAVAGTTMRAWDVPQASSGDATASAGNMFQRSLSASAAGMSGAGRTGPLAPSYRNAAAGRATAAPPLLWGPGGSAAAAASLVRAEAAQDGPMAAFPGGGASAHENGEVRESATASSSQSLSSSRSSSPAPHALHSRGEESPAGADARAPPPPPPQVPPVPERAPHSKQRGEAGSSGGIVFGTVGPDMLEQQQQQHQQREHAPIPTGRLHQGPASELGAIAQLPDTASMPEDFPHLALINDLLEEDMLVGAPMDADAAYFGQGNGPPSGSRKQAPPGANGLLPSGMHMGGVHQQHYWSTSPYPPTTMASQAGGKARPPGSGYGQGPVSGHRALNGAAQAYLGGQLMNGGYGMHGVQHKN